MNKSVSNLFRITTALSLLLGVPLLVKTNKEAQSVEGYSTSSLPTTIDLNDTTEANIRSYYSSLNNKTQSERQGTNLLRNLKTILKNGQKYYSYDSGNAIWQIYEIADRDWSKSPASSTSYGTYNSSTKKITNYQYGTSSSSSKNNPYIHALYINRNITNQTTAWDDHQQTQWGINREHVWPKAEGFETSGAGGARGDPMHLMAGNGYANNIHSNYYYGYVNTSSSYTNCGSKYFNISGNLLGKSKTLGGSTNVFEPQDCDKGDIARAIFYMVARYNYLSGSDSDGIDSNNPNLALTQSLSDWASSGYSSTTSTTGKMGIMTDLLAWHHADPVDEFEIHRNNLLYTNYTNNRNPFIDFPEWADFIWGSVNYTGSKYNSHSTTPTGYATPSSDTINGYNSGGATVSVTGVSLDESSISVEAGKDTTLMATVTPSNATNQGVSWTTSNSNVATVSGGIVTGVAEGNATITATTSDGGYTATCAVTVTASQGGDSGDGTATGSVTAASGELSGWDDSGAGSAYADGSVKLDSSGDYVYKLDIFTGDVSSGMTSLTVTINSKINGTPTASNSYKVEALDSSGNVLASDVKTGASVVETGYGDTTFTISSGLSGCTGIRITYVTKGGGNWGIKTVSWSATYSSGSQEAILSSIVVKTAPSTLSYSVGDDFSPVGLVITATYSDNSTVDVAYDGNEDAFDFDPYDDLQNTDTSVTISYGGKTCTQSITVTSTKTLSSISIDATNVTKSFEANDSFDYTGLVVTAYFSDSTSTDISNIATISSPDMSTIGEKTITVSYTYGGTTKTATYTITVSETSSATDSTQYSLINSTSALEAGKSYIITNGTSETVKAIAVTSNTSNRKTTDVVVSNGKITRGSSVMSFTLGGTTNAYTFETENYEGTNGYLSSADVSVASNSLKINTTVNTATINFDGDACVIVLGPHASRNIIRYNANNGSPIFSCYSSGQSPVYLWKEVDTSQPLTSISANVSKTYSVGETIVSSDITVTGNNGLAITGFTFSNNNYQFTYADAASGGIATSKTFTDAITYQEMSCSLTVSVSREEYIPPEDVSITLVSSSAFSGIGGSNSNLKSGSVIISGITYNYYQAYYYSGGSALSFGNASNIQGYLKNQTAIAGGITNVTVTSTGRAVNIRYSTDGETWVLKANADVDENVYKYFKIDCAGNSGSNYSNISQISITANGTETATNVSNYIMFNDTNGQCEDKFETAELRFNRMSVSERANFMTSDDYVISTARERLTAWANHFGKTIVLSDGDYVIQNAKSINIFSINSKTVNTIIIIVAGILLSSVSVGGYFFLKSRRKEDF